MKRIIYEHKEKLSNGFYSKYNLSKLVYYEVFSEIGYAISLEKKIKAGTRQKKLELINAMNPDWKDLYDEL